MNVSAISCHIHPCLFTFIHDLFSKWGQCQSCQFEMLYAKRQSYNCNTQQYAKCKMRKAYPYTSQKYPKNIHQYTKATSRIGTTPNLFPKWTQCQQRHFEGLQTKRDHQKR